MVRMKAMLSREHIEALTRAAQAQARTLDPEAANRLRFAAATLANAAPALDELACESERGMEGLRLIAKAIRQHGDTGQGRRLARFVAGLYNGPRFPFDLTDIRGLDTELADACLAVLNYDRLGIAEIHRWGVVTDEEINQWLQNAGLYYGAQARRIGRELYEAKYGDKGHPDEGLTG